MKNSVIKCLILLNFIKADKHLTKYKNALAEVVAIKGIGNGVFSQMKSKVFGLLMEWYLYHKRMIHDILEFSGQNFSCSEFCVA